MTTEKPITQKMSLREAAQTALEALEWCSDLSQQTIQHQPLHDAINSLRGALADYDAFAERVRKNFPTKREKTILFGLESNYEQS